MKHLKKILWITGIIAIAIGAWFYFYGNRSGGSSSPLQGAGGGMPPQPVVAVPVKKQTLAREITAVGTLQASESAELSAEVAGQVMAIPLEEGQEVEKDQVLVELDNRVIKAELSKSEAELTLAQSKFNRSLELKKSKFISEQDLDQATSNLQGAKAAVDSAKIRLEKSRIIAPFRGIVGLRRFSVGDYIQVGQLLTTVDIVDPILVEFSVPEKNYADIHMGQQVMVETDAFPGKKYTGQVFALDSRINPDTRNFHVKARIPNSEKTLRAGMFARVAITGRIEENALTVPEEAIIPKGDEQYVFVVKQGKAVLTKIAEGMRDKGQVQVVNGLTEDDMVITDGVLRVQDGAPVNPLPAKTPEKQ